MIVISAGSVGSDEVLAFLVDCCEEDASTFGNGERGMDRLWRL